jgi:hypothetical protein
LDSKRNWIRGGEGDSKRLIATKIFKKFLYFLQVTGGDAWVNGLEHQSFNQEVMRPWVQIPAEPVIKIVGSAL